MTTIILSRVGDRTIDEMSSKYRLEIPAYEMAIAGGYYAVKNQLTRIGDLNEVAIRDLFLQAWIYGKTVYTK